MAMLRLNLAGKTVLMDREYIGIYWRGCNLKFLKKNEIDFVVRLKKEVYKDWVNDAGGKGYSALEKKMTKSVSAEKAVSKNFELEDLESIGI